VWICPQCNAEVERQAGDKCPHGHALFQQHLLMPTKVKSFGDAFWIGVLYAVIAVAIFYLLARFVSPNIFAGANSLFVVIALPLFALMAIIRGVQWKRQGGPVARLAPRAFGTAAGWLAFVAVVLVAGFILKLRR
jgi:hypothetical protein